MIKLSKIKNKIISWYYKNAKKVEENDYKNSNIVEENTLPLKIKSLDEYRRALKDGITEFDFSDLDTTGEDIQDLYLENKNFCALWSCCKIWRIFFKFNIFTW